MIRTSRGCAWALVACLCWALGAAGCRRPPAEMVVALPAGPTTLDPLRAEEEFTYTVLSNVYQGLVERDQDLRMRPALAESWRNPDDRTLVFRLRQGSRSHDGREVSASRVKQSLLALRAAGQLLDGDAIESIDAPDPLTLEVRTRWPASQIVQSIGGARLSWPDPRHPDGPPFGSGPYKVAAWSRGGDTRLEAAFPASPDALSVPRVWFRAVADGGERVQSLRAGSVHLVVDVPAPDFASLSGVPGVRTAARPGLRVLMLGMDCAHAVTPYVDATRNPFRDVRVRRAVSMAVDRDALVKEALGGLADVADQVVAPEVSGYVPGLPPQSRDLAEARRLLRDAGFPKGFGANLDYAMAKYRSVQAVAEQLRAQLAEVGVRLTLNPLAPAEILGRLDRRDSAFFLVGWLTHRDASVSYELLLHTPRPGFGSSNQGGYADAEVDAWIEAARRLPPGEEHRENLRRIVERMRRDVPLVPLYRQRDLYAWAEAVSFSPYLDRSIFGAELAWTH